MAACFRESTEQGISQCGHYESDCRCSSCSWHDTQPFRRVGRRFLCCTDRSVVEQGMVDDFEDDVGDEVGHAVAAVGDCGGTGAAVIGRGGGGAEDAVGVDDADGTEDRARDVGDEGFGLRCGAAVVGDEDGEGVAAEGAVGARIVDEAEVVDGCGMSVRGEVARAGLVVEGGAAFGESGTDACGAEGCVARHDGAYGHGGECGVGGEEAVHQRSGG